jgi:hypothetical protein
VATTRFPDFRLTVAGSTYALPSPYLQFTELVAYSRERGSSLGWTWRGSTLSPRDGTDPFLGQTVALEYDVGSGFVPVFTGRCLAVGNQWSDQGWVRQYSAIGLRNLGDRVPITNTTTGGDTHHFNVDPDDWYNYQAELAGRTVGEILENVLTDPTLAAALDTLGIGGYTSLGPPTLPTDTTDDLDAMTTIPPYHVIVNGEKALGALESSLRTMAPNHWLHIEPDGTIRLLDQRLFGSGTAPYPAVITLEMGDDAADPNLIHVPSVQLQVDVANSFPRVVVRGDDWAEMKLFTLDDGGVEEVFDHDGLDNEEAKDLWKLDDFESPDASAGQARATATVTANVVTAFSVTNSGFGYSAAPTVTVTGGGGSGATGTASISGGKVTGIAVGSGGSGYTSTPTVSLTAPDGGTGDSGTCTTPTTTTLLVTSADNKKAWPSNYWDQTSTGRHGVVWATYTSGAGVTARVNRKITSNTALAAAGTSTLTLDRALPSTSFDEYTIRGYAGGASIVWRRYQLTDSTVRLKIRPIATFPAPLTNANGTAVTMTSTPACEVLWSSSGNPPEFQIPCPITIDFETGYLYTEVPVVTYFGTRANLLLGGPDTDGIPTNIRFFLPIATGALTATYPADVSGSPVYEGTSYTVEGIADTLTVTVPQWKDPTQLTQMEAYAADLHDAVKDTVIEGTIPMARFDARFLTVGQGVKLTGQGYATPFADITLPVVECVIKFEAGLSKYRTELKVSNRRMPFSAGQFLQAPIRPLPLIPQSAALFVPPADLSGYSGPSATSPTMEPPFL